MTCIASDKTLALDRVAIRRTLPHRDPFLLVDSVLSLEPGKAVRASMLATGRQWWAASYSSPGCGMPHSLVLEALAQASGILLAHSTGDGTLFGTIGLLARISSCKFGRPVLQHDRLSLVCRLIQWRHSLATLTAHASIDDQMVVDSEIALFVRGKADEGAVRE